MDPWTAESIQIYKKDYRDPWTADLVRAFKGECSLHYAEIYGPLLWSEFIKGME